MRKILLGLAATAAIAAPLVAATSAQAATTTSTDPACVPVTEKSRRRGQPHRVQVQARRGHRPHPVVHRERDQQIFGGVAYVRDGNKTQTSSTARLSRLSTA